MGKPLLGASGREGTHNAGILCSRVFSPPNGRPLPLLRNWTYVRERALERDRQQRGRRGSSSSCCRLQRLDLIYPSICAVAAGSSLTVAGLLPARQQHAELTGKGSAKDGKGLAVRARDVALNTMSFIPYMNFLAWLAMAANSRDSASMRLRFGAYALLYSLPSAQLLGQAAEDRSLVVALCGVLLCPAHIFLERTMVGERRAVPSATDAEREAPEMTHTTDKAAQRSNSKRISSEPSQTTTRRPMDVRESEAAAQTAARSSGDLRSMDRVGGAQEEAVEVVLQELREEALSEDRSARGTWDRRMELRAMTVKDLRVLARTRKVAGRSRMRKAELVAALEELEGLGSGEQTDS